MASEAVKKILEAEALADKKTAEARRKKDEILNSASGSSVLAIQKRISDATAEAAKLRADYDSQLAEYEKKADEEYEYKIKEIRTLAEKNSDRAVDEIIKKFF